MLSVGEMTVAGLLGSTQSGHLVVGMVGICRRCEYATGLTVGEHTERGFGCMAESALLWAFERLSHSSK